MDNSEIKSIINSQIERLHGFAFALTGDENKADELIIDAFTVLLVKERDYLKDLDTSLADKLEDRLIHNFIAKNMFKNMLDIMSKRKNDEEYTRENLYHDSFFKLDLLGRSILYFKDVLGYKIDEIQDIFEIQKHQVIEKINSSRHHLIREASSENLEITQELF